MERKTSEKWKDTITGVFNEEWKQNKMWSVMQNNAKHVSGLKIKKILVWNVTFYMSHKGL